jgi:hypothetical protein
MPNLNPIITDQIQIDGNTYTLGLTTAGSITTGPRSSEILGLSSGTTYYFAVVAFETLSGYSGWAGPVVVFTYPRFPIYAFAWAFPHDSRGIYDLLYYTSGITQNLLASSNDLLNSNVWNQPSGDFSLSHATGITPPAGMSAFSLTVSGSTGYKFALQNQGYFSVTAGVTYTYSFYINATEGITQNFDTRISYYFDGNTTGTLVPFLRQIEPEIRTNTSSQESNLTLGFSGASGWTRIIVNVVPKINEKIKVSSYQINGTFNTIPSKPYYLAGFNFNEGSTPSNFISTGIIPEFDSNVYSSDGLNVLYDASESLYANFNKLNGLTYIYPQIPTHLQLSNYKNWLSPTSKIEWQKSNSLKRYARILKGFTAGSRAIYPTFMSNFWLWKLENDLLSLNGPGGQNLTYYDIDGNSTTYPLCGNSYHWGLWITGGICLGQQIWNQVMLDFKDFDSNCDYFIHNQENVSSAFSPFEIFPCSGNTFAIRDAIINDPRYRESFFGLTSWYDFMESFGGCGYLIQDTVYDETDSYITWDVYGNALFRKSLDLMVMGYDTYDDGRFKNAIQTDAYSFNGDGAIDDGPPSPFGFHPINQKYVMGNSPSPTLYGWYQFGWENSVIYGSNYDKIKFKLSTDPLSAGETRPSPFPIAWLPFLFDMQTLRLAKRGSPTLPMVPVIPSLRFFGQPLQLPGQSPDSVNLTFAQGVTADTPSLYYADVNQGYNSIAGVTFTVAGGNSAYFYELVRHACLSGSRAFNWWNPVSFFNAELWGACYGTNFAPMKSLEIQSGINYARDYTLSGDTTYVYDMKYLNNILDECNTRLGGYTIRTHVLNRINYTSEYVVSGAPGPTGGSWWRVTIKPGTTYTVQGITLPKTNGEIGEWFFTLGDTLTNIVKIT